MKGQTLAEFQLSLTTNIKVQMKRLLILGIFFVMGNLYAESQNLVLWLNSGEKVSFDLEQTPVTTYANRQLTISTKTISVTYHLEQVWKYTYEGLSNDINTIEQESLSVKQEGNILTIATMGKDPSVEVYAADGRPLNSLVISDGEQVVVDLSTAPAGVYLINADGQIYKFFRE